MNTEQKEVYVAPELVTPESLKDIAVANSVFIGRALAGPGSSGY